MVRLAWCRVHNGVFQQPRRSIFGVAITPGQDADLTFLGRTADSLIFSVTNASRTDGYADPSAPGFRYDLAADEAVVLPQVTAPPPAPTFLGTLPAYPYFVYFAPGTHLFPLGRSPGLAVARALRSHCRFEAALQWYRLAFDPCTGTAPGSNATRTRGRRLHPGLMRRAPSRSPVRAATHRVPAATAPTFPVRRRGTARSCCTTSRRWWSGATPSAAAATRRKRSSRRA